MSFLRLLGLSLIVQTSLLANAQTWNPMQLQHSARSVSTMGDAVYAASIGLGVYRTYDDAGGWALANTGLPNPGTIRSIGRTGNVLLAGFLPQNDVHQVYRSTDGGNTWQISNSGIPAANTAVPQIPFPNKFFRVNGVTLVLLTNTIANGGGMYRSDNDGLNWSMGHSGMNSNMVVHHIAYTNWAMFAATSTGIYTSTNGALNWQAVPGTNYNTFALQIVGNRMIAVSDFGVRYSDNWGATWNNSAGLPSVINRGELISYDGKLFLSTGSNQNTAQVYRSTDNGVTFSLFQTGLGSFDQLNQNQFHASPSKLYLGALEDVYWLQGTSVDMAEDELTSIALYPTVFQDGFTVDLSSLSATSTLVITDAAGREVQRIDALPAAPVRIPRGDMVAGRYHCYLIDTKTGTRREVGQVIADR